MYHYYVPLCTTRFIINKFAFSPSVPNALILHYQLQYRCTKLIHWTLYRRHCVFCEVQTEYWHAIYINFSVYAQLAFRRPFTAETGIGFRASVCESCGAESGTGRGLSSSASVFPCQCYSINSPSSYLSVMTKNRRTNQRTLEFSIQSNAFFRNFRASRNKSKDVCPTTSNEGPEQSRGICLQILNLGIKLGWLVVTRLRPLYSRKRNSAPCVHQDQWAALLV